MNPPASRPDPVGAQVAFRAVVSGYVQGVGFRYSAMDSAARLGIFGWVKNLSSGQVETCFQGRPEACRLFREWLELGPPGAEVTSVDVESRPIGDFEGFTVRY